MRNLQRDQVTQVDALNLVAVVIIKSDHRCYGKENLQRKYRHYPRGHGRNSHVHSSAGFCQSHEGTVKHTVLALKSI